MEQNKFDQLFDRNNSILLIVSVLVIAVGFVIMLTDKAEYGFGFNGLTLGPIILMLGFLLPFYSILKKHKGQ